MNTPTYKAGILQVKAFRILQSKVSQTLSKFDLNPSEWSILGLISASTNGIRLAEVASALNVETPLITALVNNLEELKLVERFNHPSDKRAKLLYLTPKGKHLIPLVENSLKETLFKLLEGVTQEELNTYRKVLEVIVTNSNKTLKGGE